MKGMLVAGVLAASGVAAEVQSTMKTDNPAAWAPLKQLLDGWKLTANFGLTVGNASGPVFEYTHGNFSLETSHCPLASSSKWPTAMMFTGLVADGTISSLDDPANKYVSWWTKDATDDKSLITLRQLLSFTSGFGDGAPGAGSNSATCMDDPSQFPLVQSYDDCAREIYTNTNLTGKPGHTYSYNSVHLQLAGAIALAASKETDIQVIVKKYLLDAYQMNSTTCANPTPEIPQIAVCMETVGADYARFLEAQLTHSVLPSALVEASEKDYTPFMSKYYTLYGDYGFGHFLECYDSVDGMTDACKAANIHADPGAFGYYPLVDRTNNYYMQIVANENGKYYSRSGIPEYLRLLAKPIVDAIMKGEDSSYDFSHHTPSLNSVSLVDVNYIVGCYVDPLSCA